jgi:hypothetical protein
MPCAPQLSALNEVTSGVKRCDVRKHKADAVTSEFSENYRSGAYPMT